MARQSSRQLPWTALVAARLLGALYAAGAALLLVTLRELRGPAWVIETFCWAGGAIAVASAWMVLASWIGRGSAWALAVAVLAGFFGSLPPIALAAGRVALPHDWPIPAWAWWLAAGLSGLLAVSALVRLMPRRRLSAA